MYKTIYIDICMHVYVYIYIYMCVCVFVVPPQVSTPGEIELYVQVSGSTRRRRSMSLRGDM